MPEVSLCVWSWDLPDRSSCDGTTDKRHRPDKTRQKHAQSVLSSSNSNMTLIITHCHTRGPTLAYQSDFWNTTPATQPTTSTSITALKWLFFHLYLSGCAPLHVSVHHPGYLGGLAAQLHPPCPSGELGTARWLPSPARWFGSAGKWRTSRPTGRSPTSANPAPRATSLCVKNRSSSSSPKCDYAAVEGENWRKGQVSPKKGFSFSTGCHLLT